RDRNVTGVQTCALPIFWILTTLVFFLMRITGDPITAALGGRLTQAQLQERIEAAGYDRPLIVQYFEYMGGLLRGDFGTTVSDNQIGRASCRERDESAGG